MLYATTEFTYPVPYNQFVLEPGRLGLIELEVVSGEKITLLMNQLIPDPLNQPQDRSIRCWISDQKGGNPQPNDTNSWILTPLQRTTIWVHDALTDFVLVDGIKIDVMPGRYWLNVLNLVNETNAFYLDIPTGE